MTPLVAKEHSSQILLKARANLRATALGSGTFRLRFPADCTRLWKAVTTSFWRVSFTNDTEAFYTNDFDCKTNSLPLPVGGTIWQIGRPSTYLSNCDRLAGPVA
jgi:hypothetical protein